MTKRMKKKELKDLSLKKLYEMESSLDDSLWNVREVIAKKQEAKYKDVLTPKVH